MVQVHKYALSELEEMMPWEREVYVSMLAQYIEKKNQNNSNPSF